MAFRALQERVIDDFAPDTRRQEKRELWVIGSSKRSAEIAGQRLEHGYLKNVNNPSQSCPAPEPDA